MEESQVEYHVPSVRSRLGLRMDIINGWSYKNTKNLGPTRMLQKYTIQLKPKPYHTIITNRQNMKINGGRNEVMITTTI
nr:hypothetical protein Itr_chr02CG01630 [Ipomoea trifida]